MDTNREALADAARGLSFDPGTITRVMEVLGLDHAGLGQLCDVSPRTARRWERGELLPFGRHLIMLAELSRVELTSMFTDRKAVPEPKDKGLTKLQQAASNMVNRLKRMGVPMPRNELLAAAREDLGIGSMTAKRGLAYSVASGWVTCAPIPGQHKAKIVTLA